MPKPKVLLVAAELTPLAKVGGLADVIGALPKALEQLGVDVRLAIPKYGSIDEKKYPMTKIAGDVSVSFHGGTEKINLYQTPLPGSNVPVYLIDNFHYLGQNGVYFEKDASSGGSNREADRFSFFARTCLAIPKIINWYPDVVHCHDWHVGMVPVLIKVLAKTETWLKNTKSLLTIHNLEYQGWYKTEVVLKALGLAQSDYPTLSIEKDGHISSLQQAILTSDYLTTVSPNYAKEIMTPQYGAGLEATLGDRSHELTGILNGIDVDHFNPAQDKLIAGNYTADNLINKHKCKEELQKICGFEINPLTPMLGLVSRLADQKGLDLIHEVFDELAKENFQFALLGTGDPKLELMMAGLAKKYPKKMFAKLTFDAKFAQEVYAGSDIFLMPSRFEPCGLGQMIAMRYGTIPVVRSTGGLKDTVADYNPKKKTGDGLVFKEYQGQPFLKAVRRALELYQDKEQWYNMVIRVMKIDFSWKNSAKKYLSLYKKLLKNNV